MAYFSNKTTYLCTPEGISNKKFLAAVVYKSTISALQSFSALFFLENSSLLSRPKNENKNFQGLLLNLHSRRNTLHAPPLPYSSHEVSLFLSLIYGH